MLAFPCWAFIEDRTDLVNRFLMADWCITSCRWPEANSCFYAQSFVQVPEYVLLYLCARTYIRIHLLSGLDARTCLSSCCISLCVRPGCSVLIKFHPTKDGHQRWSFCQRKVVKMTRGVLDVRHCSGIVQEYL